MPLGDERSAGTGEDPRVLRPQTAARDHSDLGVQQVLEGAFRAGVIQQRVALGEVARKSAVDTSRRRRNLGAASATSTLSRL